MNLTPNIRYTVTKASDDGTLEVGDHIKLLDDGVIACIEAKGWIDAEDVPEATKGMECEVDQEYIKRQKSKLLAALTKLNELEEPQ